MKAVRRFVVLVLFTLFLVGLAPAADAMRPCVRLRMIDPFQDRTICLINL
jgi:hypothetical protein